MTIHKGVENVEYRGVEVYEDEEMKMCRQRCEDGKWIDEEKQVEMKQCKICDATKERISKRVNVAR